MTPKDKSLELFHKFAKQWHASPDDCKKNCIIAVDEIINLFKGLHKPEYVSFDIYEPKQYHNEEGTDFNGYTMSEYWEQVKSEISKL